MRQDRLGLVGSSGKNTIIDNETNVEADKKIRKTIIHRTNCALTDILLLRYLVQRGQRFWCGSSLRLRSRWSSDLSPCRTDRRSASRPSPPCRRSSSSQRTRSYSPCRVHSTGIHTDYIRSLAAITTGTEEGFLSYIETCS